jgi:hypothetical protein
MIDNAAGRFVRRFIIASESFQPYYRVPEHRVTEKAVPTGLVGMVGRVDSPSQHAGP